ncbi:MAG: glycogen debranching enzyme, partial [Isosphaeraceae bacterium]
DDPRVNALRQCQMRNFLTLLLISQGVPFLSHGDEFARTQLGNNNAYCQDNEISWVDWGLAQKNAGLLRFTRMMIALRQRFFAIYREEFIRRMTWHGTRLGDPDWTGKSRTLAFQMHGWHGLPDLHVMLNAHWETQRFALPPHRGQWCWRRLVDTVLPSPEDITEEANAVPVRPVDHYYLSPRSTVILISS